MKKTVSILMFFILLFCFTACSSTTDIEESSSALQSSTESSLSDKENGSQNDYSQSSFSSSESSETGSKSLVVYFSWSGNTQNVAEAIKANTDSDIFEIIPETPYSDDYDTVLELAQEEQSKMCVLRFRGASTISVITMLSLWDFRIGGAICR